MTIIYCFDAYCGWCYGFSPVIKRIASDFSEIFHFEVLPGGMILPEKPIHISATAGYIRKAYPRVESLTGVKFGKDYLWHIENPEESDWYPHSEKPSVALYIFKEYYPGRQVEFAADLQLALHAEGRDLCDDEAYRHLLQVYDIPENEFYNKLHDPVYKEKTYEEFDLVKRLKVTGYPTVLLQVTDSRFLSLASGFTTSETLKERIRTVLKQIETLK